MTSFKRKLYIKNYNFMRNTFSALYRFHDFIVFVINCLLIIFSLLIASWIRFEFNLPYNHLIAVLYFIPIAIIVKFFFFYLFKIFHGLWRYVSLNDIVRIFFANLLASLVLFLIVEIGQRKFAVGVSRNVIIIDFMLCFFMKSGSRVFVRLLREKKSIRKHSDIITKTLLVGSAYSSNQLLQAFNESSKQRHFVGIICDELTKGKRLRNVTVLGSKKNISELCQKTHADEILLLPPCSNHNELNEIVNILDKENIQCSLRMVPAYADIADGEFNISMIKDVEIEDLLGRLPIDFNNEKVKKYISGKNILITGAGGSIGSELTRQLAEYNPNRLVLFELSEFNLYQISMEMDSKFPLFEKKYIVGDIRNRENVINALKNNKIDVVFHAAAYKHVPLMEMNVPMAFHTNVIGSNILASACEDACVEKFVLISTDKAVNPTSVMGSTKRLAERTILEKKSYKTTFCAVRFGNVLGSSGSVIPLFKKQIKEGGPLTVTSKNMTRYFMSIPEAVNLVLQAGSIGDNGDIMVLEMGQPMRIYDMARKLIELSGFRPEIDIKIKVTGLRPGEKEYEELLTDTEKVNHTCLNKIFTVKMQPVDRLPQVDVELIKKLIDESNSKKLMKLIKNYIPEFIG